MGIISYIKEEIQVVRERDPVDQIEYGSVAVSQLQGDSPLSDRP